MFQSWILSHYSWKNKCISSIKYLHLFLHYLSNVMIKSGIHLQNLIANLRQLYDLQNKPIHKMSMDRPVSLNQSKGPLCRTKWDENEVFIKGLLGQKVYFIGSWGTLKNTCLWAFGSRINGLGCHKFTFKFHKWIHYTT